MSKELEQTVNRNVIVFDYMNDYLYILLVPDKVKTIEDYENWLSERFNLSSIHWMVSEVNKLELYIEKGSIQYTSIYTQKKSDKINEDCLQIKD